MKGLANVVYTLGLLEARYGETGRFEKMQRHLGMRYTSSQVTMLALEQLLAALDEQVKENPE